ncbi:MAG: gamma carbonic anhydrase family protein [Steroidobacteraceae bacterium]
MIYTLGERRLETLGEFYVAPSAQLIGSVRLGDGASVWFNVVIRADNDLIEVGRGSNVQDCSVLHNETGVPTIIGADCTIGHKVLLHSCTIGDATLVGNGAMVLDRARVGRNCVIAAGALVPPGKVIPDGSMVMGAPGQVVRQVTERDLAMIARGASVYRERAAEYRERLRIDPRNRDGGLGVGTAAGADARPGSIAR